MFVAIQFLYFGSHYHYAKKILYKYAEKQLNRLQIWQNWIDYKFDQTVYSAWNKIKINRPKIETMKTCRSTSPLDINLQNIRVKQVPGFKFRGRSFLDDGRLHSEIEIRDKAQVNSDLSTVTITQAFTQKSRFMGNCSTSG